MIHVERYQQKELFNPVDNMPRQRYLVMKLLFFTILLVLQNPRILCKGTTQGSSVSEDSTSWNIDEHDEGSDSEQDIPGAMMTLHPTVFIPIQARNKAHTLATFFGCLERLQYPKDRMSLWFQQPPPSWPSTPSIGPPALPLLPRSKKHNAKILGDFLTKYLHQIPDSRILNSNVTCLRGVTTLGLRTRLLSIVPIIQT